MELLLLGYAGIIWACTRVSVDHWREAAILFLGVTTAGGIVGFAWDAWVAGRLPISW